MALVKCGECGNDVSTLAAACPKCGAPVPKTQPAQPELPPQAVYPSGPQAAVQRITLERPNQKAEFEPPPTVGSGLGCGFVLGVLVAIFAIARGTIQFGVPGATEFAPEDVSGMIIFTVVVALVCMLIGGGIMASESARPPKEKVQRIELAYVCPYCKKTVSYSHSGAVTRVAVDLQSIKCSVCGNISIVDWEAPPEGTGGVSG